MGKNTVQNKKKRLAKKKKKILIELNVEALTVEQLLAKAQSEVDSFNWQSAQALCQEALKRDADHVPALEISGNLCVEAQNLEGAKHCYGRAITLQPDEGHNKYLAMAELLNGTDSVQCYLKGIEIINKEITKEEEESKVSSAVNVEKKEIEPSSKETDPSIKEAGTSNVLSIPPPKPKILQLKHELSSTYCSLSELFMTDLCEEQDAESRCREYADKAIESDVTNPEAYQQMANFLLVKEEPDQAAEFMMKSVNLWLPKYKSVDEGTAACGSFDPVEVCPVSYGCRLSCAKLLIELEKHEVASDVLESMLDEDDEVVDTWYLLGWNAFLQGAENFSSARESFVHAMKVHKKVPSNDASMIDHINQLLEEIGPISSEEMAEDLDDDNDDDDEEAIIEELLKSNDDDQTEEMDTN